MVILLSLAMRTTPARRQGSRHDLGEVMRLQNEGCAPSLGHLQGLGMYSVANELEEVEFPKRCLHAHVLVGGVQAQAGMRTPRCHS